MLNKNTQILDEQLNISQKTLLGVSDVDSYNEKQPNYQQQQEQQHHHHQQQTSDSIQTPVKSIHLPPFFLTSSQKRMIYDDALLKDDYIPTTAGSPIYSSLNNSIKVSPSKNFNNESINLSEKYVNKFIKEIEEHEKQQLYGAVLTNGTTQFDNSFNGVDDTSNNSNTINKFLNYQQKQICDRFSELRNYQYQVGTKSVQNNSLNYYEQFDHHQLQLQQQLSPFTNKSIFQSLSNVNQTNFIAANNEATTQTSGENKTTQVKSEPGTGSSIVNSATINPQTEASSQKSDQSFRTTKEEQQQTHIYRRTLSTKQIILESPIDTIDQLWCKKFGINRIKLDLERENIRKWLSKTILKPIVNEIGQSNEILIASGCLDMKIGQASIAQLVEFIKTPKSLLLPNLSLLAPYLEQTSNQDYLVQRLKELSMTSVISEYFWDGGGIYKNKEWSDYLPTDASILMHCFCTYMNSRLIPHPRYAINKPFTMQYYFKNPQINQTNNNSTNTDQQLSINQQLNINQRNELTSLYFYEYKAHPPIYKVIYNKEIFDIATGRNNIFDAIICFLHIAKTELKSMLGPVCLDSSGINILCVIE